MENDGVLECVVSYEVYVFWHLREVLSRWAVLIFVVNHRNYGRNCFEVCRWLKFNEEGAFIIVVGVASAVEKVFKVFSVCIVHFYEPTSPFLHYFEFLMTYIFLI